MIINNFGYVKYDCFIRNKFFNVLFVWFLIICELFDFKGRSFKNKIK